MNSKRVIVKVLIENDQVFSDEYNTNQKIQVVVNKTLANFKIESENRILRHEDGQQIQDFTKTIEESGVQDGECLRYVKKSDKPNRDKGFA